MNQYSTLVATNPLDMPTTREHPSVYSRQDPPSDDEDDPYALPPEEEGGRADPTIVPDVDYDVTTPKPVPQTLLVLMAVTNDRYHHVHSIDVKTSFLHAS